MGRTKEEMLKMAEEKRNSKKTVDRLVMDELLEMGFSYGNVGTHYIHDSIVFSVSLDLKDFKDARALCLRVNEMVSKKYDISKAHYCQNVHVSISRVFIDGNINYLLDTLKWVYDYDKMSVAKNDFIMTVRENIIRSLDEQREFNVTQLRLIIQGTVENITDIRVLEGMCNIVLSLNGDIALNN